MSRAWIGGRIVLVQLSDDYAWNELFDKAVDAAFDKYYTLKDIEGPPENGLLVLTWENMSSEEVLIAESLKIFGVENDHAE